MKKPEGSRCSIVSSSTPGYSQQAAAVIRSGGIVALPTETCYGLAVDPFSNSAVNSIFELKNRSHSKPLLVLIETMKFLDQLVREIPEPYIPLIDKYWPGPLTLIFPAHRHLPDLLTGGSGTIGIRISSNPVASEICSAAGGAVTATSANMSGHKPASSASEIIDMMGYDIDMTIDGGKSEAKQCSTIVAQRNGRLELVRAGQINISNLADF